MFVIALLAAVQGDDPLAVVVDPIRPDQNVLHYHVSVEIPDSGTVIQGATTITWRIEGGAGPLVLDFDRVFTVDSVRSEGMDVRAAFRDDTTLHVDRWGNPGETREVTIYYHGSPADGLFIRDNVHGERTAFADNWPNRAHHWFPSEDHPGDKATASFAVTVPGGWRVVANGVLEAVDSIAGGRTRWWWRTERRIPVYTMVIGGGRMSVTEISRGGGPSHTVWTFPQDSAFDGPFARAQRMLEEYTRLIGPFPYSKLAHVQSSTRFGGMENSSAIFYSEDGYARRSMGDGVVAHETAHQWFGDAVTEYDWHHLWLSEGFASYFNPVFFEVIGDHERFRTGLEASKRRYLNSPVVNRPVIDTAETNYFSLLNANNYPKGAWILHMLRREIGDDAFFGRRAGLLRHLSGFHRALGRPAGRDGTPCGPGVTLVLRAVAAATGLPTAARGVGGDRGWAPGRGLPGAAGRVGNVQDPGAGGGSIRRLGTPGDGDFRARGRPGLGGPARRHPAGPGTTRRGRSAGHRGGIRRWVR